MLFYDQRFESPRNELFNIAHRWVVFISRVDLNDYVVPSAWRARRVNPRAANPTPSPVTGSVASYQERVAAAHPALFHDDPTDLAERLARHKEEDNELCQSLGMSREEAHRLVDYTWDRPVGEPAKEIGSTLLTLASLCVVAGYDMAECGEADLEKLQRPETIARIRAKRATRHGRGPLPGLDPTASLDEAALVDALDALKGVQP